MRKAFRTNDVSIFPATDEEGRHYVGMKVGQHSSLYDRREATEIVARYRETYERMRANNEPTFKLLETIEYIESIMPPPEEDDVPDSD